MKSSSAQAHQSTRREYAKRRNPLKKDPTKYDGTSKCSNTQKHSNIYTKKKLIHKRSWRLQCLLSLRATELKNCKESKPHEFITKKQVPKNDWKHAARRFRPRTTPIATRHAKIKIAQQSLGDLIAHLCNRSFFVNMCEINIAHQMPQYTKAATRICMHNSLLLGRLRQHPRIHQAP